jgi:hypothetical protein
MFSIKVFTFGRKFDAKMLLRPVFMDAKTQFSCSDLFL